MAKGSILVVEGEEIEALDLQARLARLGYAIAGRAAGGGQALLLAESTRPDLVLMDVVLPGGMDGIETARRLHEKGSPPVVYLTAAGDADVLERAKATGPYGYLRKPFDDRELALSVELAIYKHRAEVRLQESEHLLSATLGSLGEAVLALNCTGRVAYLNPAAERLLGVGGAEALHHGYAELLSVLDEDTRRPVAVEKLCAPGSSSSEELLVAGRTGREVPVSLSVTPVLGPGGELCGRVVVLRDVTRRRRTEAALRQSLAGLRTALHQTVRALASMAEKRDPYTAGHQQRVARLACAVGRELGLSPDALEGLEMAGTLHDIGKVCVPAEILAKPARLSAMEMGIMKTHPEVGYEILHEVSFPWPVARAVLEHHERMDGSGYPAGLHGSEICREARILAVADVVEAMSSHRPYRPALGLDKALAEIRNGRGRLYDPEVVDACLRVFAGGTFSFDFAPAPAGPPTAGALGGAA